MRTQRAHARKIMLTPAQRHQVMAVAIQLPPSQRDAFIVRTELKLRGGGEITNGLVSNVIANVLDEVGTM